jgi:hypothetical protein
MLKKSLILFVLCLAAIAQEASPKIVFTKSSHDFKVIEQGDKVKVDFEFKNTGNAELVIENVKTSCGCTSATPEKKNYAPGEGGVIPVTFNSTRFNGPITKTITITSNDPENPRTQLRISGKVLTEVNAYPTSLTVIDVKRNETITREIKVTSEKLDKLEITDLKAGENLTFLKLETERVDPKTVNIKVSFDGADLPKDKDVSRGTITYKTNSTKFAEMRTTVFIKTTRPVQVRPGTVYFFSSPEGKSRESIVELTPTLSDEMKILKVESDLDFVTAEMVEGGKVKVTLTDKAEKGKFNGVITVKTDLAEQDTVKIPVRGTVI